LRAYLAVSTEESHLSPVVEKISVNIPAFLKLLNDETQKSISLSSGSVASFGTVRLSVLEFLLALNRLDHPKLDETFQKENFFSIILGLFFRHPVTNIVHDVIAQAFFAAFNRPEDYILSVIKDTKIMEILLQTWEKYDKAHALEDELMAAHPDLLAMRFITASTALTRYPEELREKVGQVKEIRNWGFMGHLALLANLISGLAKHGEGELKAYIESQPGWRDFVEGSLKVYNAKSQPPSLANQWSIDSDEGRNNYDEDEEDEDEEEEEEEEEEPEEEEDAERDELSPYEEEVADERFDNEIDTQVVDGDESLDAALQEVTEGGDEVQAGDDLDEHEEEDPNRPQPEF